MNDALSEQEFLERRNRSTTVVLVGGLLGLSFGANVFVAVFWFGAEIGIALVATGFAAFFCGVAGWWLREDVRSSVLPVVPAIVVGPQAPLVGAGILVPAASWWHYPALISLASVQLIGYGIGVVGNGWWSRRALRDGRRLCAGCGYPRAGLPVGAKCPECGVDSSVDEAFG